jgi:release factor glutamine methyltransferase
VTIAEVLRGATGYLERKGVDSPRLDAELLLANALGCTRLELYTEHDRELTDGERATARALVERRGSREPLAYILGEWGFRKLTLQTDARALVPRPETEMLVERALARIAGLEAPNVVDVGTGSGAIALAIASERPHAHVIATDASQDALTLARENAERLSLDVELVHTNLLDGIAGPVELVVSNPPYVLDGEELPPELDYEPAVALYDRGQTTDMADAARGVLDGWLVLECHEDRAQDVARVLADLGYADIAVTRDLAGRDRIVEARWTP